MTPEKIVAMETMNAALQGYEDEGLFVPGTTEVLSDRWSNLASYPPDRLAEEVARRIESGLADRFKNPGYDPASAKVPVVAAIRRHSAQLKDGAVDELARSWAASLAGRAPIQLAGEVARRINSPENVRYLRNPPELSANQTRMYSLLSNFHDVLPEEGKTRLIAERGRDFQNLSDRQVISAVAATLSTGLGAKRYSASRVIARDDERNQALDFNAGSPHAPKPATTTPSRDAAGRFGSTPTPPARKPGFSF